MPWLRRLSTVLAGTLLLLVPAACQFPGAAVAVAFTSPKDGSPVVGARTITVTGELTGATPGTFELTLNGATPVAATFPSAGRFSASVTLADGANTLVARATASGVTATATLQLSYPYLRLASGQAASLAIGQTNLTSFLPATDQQHLAAPAGAGVVVGGALYLPDSGNQRVVGLASVPASSGALFTRLLGKPPGAWLDGSTELTSRTTFRDPGGVAEVAGGLAVADTGNHRVLLWTGAPLGSADLARAVLGQPGFTTSTPNCSAAYLDHPTDVVAAGGHIIVADSGNDRVLIWDATTPASGAAADLVLGQKDFTSCSSNRGGAAGPATLAAPTGVWSDGKRLVVADSGNNRVLIWTSFPTSNGQPADLVLGQAGMTGSDANRGGTAGAATLSGPVSVSSNGNQLFVADGGNHRVLVWNAFPGTDGTPADVVLGQAGMTGSDANRGGTAGAATLSDPRGVRALDSGLLVADSGNARELIYRP